MSASLFFVVDNEIMNHLVVARQSMESWSALGMQNLDKLGTEIRIHGGEEASRMNTMFEKRIQKQKSLGLLLSSASD